MTSSAYHVFELLFTGTAVAASAGFVFKGWVRALVARRRPGTRAASASPGGCTSCNSCGECSPAEHPKESTIVFVRPETRR